MKLNESIKLPKFLWAEFRGMAPSATAKKIPNAVSEILGDLLGYGRGNPPAVVECLLESQRVNTKKEDQDNDAGINTGQ